MKKVLIILLMAAFFISCNNDANKSDNEKIEKSSEAAEASDTTGIIDKSQENMNNAIDTAQSKGQKIIEAAGDSLKKNVIEPVKNDMKKAGDKIKEAVDQVKEKVKQQ